MNYNGFEELRERIDHTLTLAGWKRIAGNGWALDSHQLLLNNRRSIPTVQAELLASAQGIIRASGTLNLPEGFTIGEYEQKILAWVHVIRSLA